ncbi:hypothetical protein PSH61_13365 [Pseudomonas rhodesiae]|uniref:hypothetical protein n=1 Tax=Pseudomonas TaxID=286 RepID=UPI002736B04E|nr:MULTISPECIES: hypothetical protein [Pseudomonas]WLH21137.1 hypothetical protein PSH75_13870 [Pseudomonas simiae]WLI32050.1 hypothetical protein PSH61_13365 [Pseudomonas rhodesiae]
MTMKKSVAGGERVNSDILDDEQRYYDALRNLAQARYAYLRSWLKVRFLAGKLSDVDISSLALCFEKTPR